MSITYSCWGQIKDKNNIAKGVTDFLQKNKTILEDFVSCLVRDTQPSYYEDDSFYFLLSNMIDLFNGEDYELLREDVSYNEIEETQKTKDIYNYIEKNYNSIADMYNKFYDYYEHLINFKIEKEYIVVMRGLLKLL